MAGFNRYERLSSIFAHISQNAETTNVIILTKSYTMFVLIWSVVYAQNDEGTVGKEYPSRKLLCLSNPFWK